MGDSITTAVYREQLSLGKAERTEGKRSTDETICYCRQTDPTAIEMLPLPLIHGTVRSYPILRGTVIHSKHCIYVFHESIYF